MNAQAEILFQQRLCASFQGQQARASVHILNFVRARQVRQHATTHFTAHSSVNINASYTEALLGKKLIRCKIYFLRIFFIYRPSYIDVFQEICFSCFLDVFSRSLSTPNVIDKDEIYIFYIFVFLCT